mmetsp:Transcript_100848/g.177549  ORF Transcript_100848/g.177549 Transcript_100848/m.177549 type:complete len:209 (+) Transcript_100848:217-843(+)
MHQQKSHQHRPGMLRQGSNSWRVAWLHPRLLQGKSSSAPLSYCLVHSNGSVRPNCCLVRPRCLIQNPLSPAGWRHQSRPGSRSHCSKDQRTPMCLPARCLHCILQHCFHLPRRGLHQCWSPSSCCQKPASSPRWRPRYRRRTSLCCLKGCHLLIPSFPNSNSACWKDRCFWKATTCCRKSCCLHNPRFPCQLEMCCWNSACLQWQVGS